LPLLSKLREFCREVTSISIWVLMGDDGRDLLLCSELDLRKSELKRPAPRDLTSEVFPTPECPKRRKDNRRAGLEVGTSCRARVSLWPVALNLSSKSATSLWPYFKAVMSARMLSELRMSMLHPAAHKHLRQEHFSRERTTPRNFKWIQIGFGTDQMLFLMFYLTTCAWPFLAAR
jgi:hypothetical protein